LDPEHDQEGHRPAAAARRPGPIVAPPPQPPPLGSRPQVDATKEPTLASDHSIRGYPTLKWFVDGEVLMDYDGPRDA
jgi:hypothetical protein